MLILRQTPNNLDIEINKDMGHRVSLDVFINMYNKIAYSTA